MKSHLKINEKRAVTQFINKIKTELGKNLISVNLFGSKVCGDFDRDSDIDILIIVKEYNISLVNKIVDAQVDFLLKYDDHAQLSTIRPVTPYPGSDLYYYAINKGLLKDVNEFYDKKHINSDLPSVNFTNLSEEEFCRYLFEANKTLLKNYNRHKLEEQTEALRKLYFKRNVAFRGFRQT